MATVAQSLPFLLGTEPARNRFRCTASSGTPEAVAVLTGSEDAGQGQITFQGADSGQTHWIHAIRTYVTFDLAAHVRTGWMPTVYLEPLGVFQPAAREFATMVHDVSPSAVIYARTAEGVLDLWAILPQRDEAVERAIAETACELMCKYSDMRFDFMVIDMDSPSASTIAQSGYITVSAE